jgi:hypothetical protein
VTHLLFFFDWWVFLWILKPNSVLRIFGIFTREFYCGIFSTNMKGICVSNLQWQDFSLGLTHSLNHSFGLLGQAAILDSYIPWWALGSIRLAISIIWIDIKALFNLSILSHSLYLSCFFNMILLITPLLLIPCRILSITNLVEKLIAMRAFITCFHFPSPRIIL